MKKLPIGKLWGYVQILGTVGFFATVPVLFLDYLNINLRLQELELAKSKFDFERLVNQISIADSICNQSSYKAKINALKSLDDFNHQIDEGFCFDYNGPKFKWDNMVEPAIGELTSSFGCSKHPVNGNLEMVKGVNISNRRGTNVKAAHFGRVDVVTEDDVFGNHIVIRHGERWFTYYGHLDEIFVQKSEVVATGQRIGTMGNSGLTTGTVLTFMISHDGIFYNPNNEDQNSENIIC